MLRELSIKNFAIIDDLSISFEEGLSILTGETGAGKSIIVNAVNLILGSRASSELIRSSENVAELDATFEVPAESPAGRVARAQGFDVSEGLWIHREIHREGRHRVYINGQPASTRILANVSEHLASIAGQHAHQNLLKPEHHLFVLDQFGGLSELRDRVSKCYQQMVPMMNKLSALKLRLSEQAERCELLDFQVREIRQAQIEPGEDEELEKERQRLKHAERLHETVSRCGERLYGIDGAAVEHVAEIGKELQSLAKIDNTLSPMATRIDNAAIELEDVASELREYLENIVFDPERLEAVELRLSLLYKLKRKYGGSLEAVLTRGEEAQEELERVSCLPDEIAETESTLAILHRKLDSLCCELSDKRKQVAVRFTKKVQEEVMSLGMAKTRFEVRFKPVPIDEHANPYLISRNAGMDATGADRVEFLIAPNVGEDLRPLAQIASGGELSRIVLALKAILAAEESVETVIFDEVDAGIGGGVAEMVGDKLDSLARFHQVICITHLPQIARFGRNHFKIAKSIYKGRTRTAITPLHGDTRVKELARMLAGIKITKKALDHAREMMIGHRQGD